MEIISLTPKNFQAAVETASRAIKKGGVIIAPTDTVYGLLADATNEKAVARLYAVKHRPLDRFLPIFVKSISMAKKLAKASAKNEKILEEKWPGKFTFIFNRNMAGKIFGVDKNTVALRIPAHPFIASLSETLNIPLTGTSANVSGQHSSTEIDKVIAQFENSEPKPDLIINAGDLPESQASAIIDLTGEKPKKIR